MVEMKGILTTLVQILRVSKDILLLNFVEEKYTYKSLYMYI